MGSTTGPVDGYCFISLNFAEKTENWLKPVVLYDVPAELHERMAEAARTEGISLQAWVLKAVRFRLGTSRDIGRTELQAIGIGMALSSG